MGLGHSADKIWASARVRARADGSVQRLPDFGGARRKRIWAERILWCQFRRILVVVREPVHVKNNCTRIVFLSRAMIGPSAIFPQVALCLWRCRKHGCGRIDRSASQAPARFDCSYRCRRRAPSFLRKGAAAHYESVLGGCGSSGYDDGGDVISHGTVMVL